MGLSVVVLGVEGILFLLLLSIQSLKTYLNLLLIKCSILFCISSCTAPDNGFLDRVIYKCVIIKYYRHVCLVDRFISNSDIPGFIATYREGSGLLSVDLRRRIGIYYCD